jgi:hypothetical protein
MHSTIQPVGHLGHKIQRMHSGRRRLSNPKFIYLLYPPSCLVRSSVVLVMPSHKNVRLLQGGMSFAEATSPARGRPVPPPPHPRHPPYRRQSAQEEEPEGHAFASAGPRCRHPRRGTARRPASTDASGFARRRGPAEDRRFLSRSRSRSHSLPLALALARSRALSLYPHPPYPPLLSAREGPAAAQLAAPRRRAGPRGRQAGPSAPPQCAREGARGARGTAASRAGRGPCAAPTSTPSYGGRGPFPRTAAAATTRIGPSPIESDASHH